MVVRRERDSRRSAGCDVGMEGAGWSEGRATRAEEAWRRWEGCEGNRDVEREEEREREPTGTASGPTAALERFEAASTREPTRGEEGAGIGFIEGGFEEKKVSNTVGQEQGESRLEV